MLIGAHVSSSAPHNNAERRDADVVQVFLSSPQMWKAPRTRDTADVWADGDLPMYAHAPYLCNPASATPAVRTKSITLLQQTLDEAARCGILGVVVHAGHGGKNSTVDQAIERWAAVLPDLSSDVPLLIENTATGSSAPGRMLDDWLRLHTALQQVNLAVPVGSCLDTAHAFAGDPTFAEDPTSWIGRFAEPTGGINLVHVNDSQAPAGAGQDRHANLGDGHMGTDLVVAAVQAAAAPAAVVETPNGAEAQAADITKLKATCT